MYYPGAQMKRLLWSPRSHHFTLPYDQDYQFEEPLSPKSSIDCLTPHTRVIISWKSLLYHYTRNAPKSFILCSDSLNVIPFPSTNTKIINTQHNFHPHKTHKYTQLTRVLTRALTKQNSNVITNEYSLLWTRPILMYRNS